MLVRRRVDTDLPGCVRALTAVHAADEYPMWWPSDPAGWLTPAGCTAAWVVEAAGSVAGHVCVVQGVPEPVAAARAGVTGDELLFVSRLFVAPDRRGARLGEALLGVAVAHAREHGLQLMLDVVEDGGAAVALYERLGWRLVDRRLADWITPSGVRLLQRVYLAPTSAGRR